MTGEVYECSPTASEYAPRTSPDGALPRILVVRVLEACNAGCFMCGFARSKDLYRFSASDMRELVEEIRETSIRHVRLTGGEPLSLPDIEPMIKMLANAGLSSSIITNGWDLPHLAEDLIRAGLRQVIVSLDAATPEKHDRFRQLAGLYDRAIAGIAATTRSRSKIITRVNTVVGPHNLADLPDLLALLADMRVEHWSIIPLKRPAGAWGGTALSELEVHLTRWNDALAKRREGDRYCPKLIGLSETPYGRSPEERSALWLAGRNIAPTSICGLVDLVRYYTPKDGRVFPCNCVSHRDGNENMCERRDRESFSASGLQKARAWLRANGPTSCQACEPANAALGAGLIDLEEDPFGF